MYKTQKLKLSKAEQVGKYATRFPLLVSESLNPAFTNNAQTFHVGERSKVGRPRAPKDGAQGYLEYTLALERLLLRSLFIKATEPAKTYGKKFRHDFRRWVEALRKESFGNGEIPTRHYKWLTKDLYVASQDTDIAHERMRKAEKQDLENLLSEAVNEDYEEVLEQVSNE